MQKEVMLCHELHWVSSAVFRNPCHVPSASSAAWSTGLAAFDSFRRLLVVPDRSSKVFWFLPSSWWMVRYL